MNIFMVGMAVWLAANELPKGTELQYSGTLSKTIINSDDVEVKSFSLNLVAVTVENGSSQLAFQMEERGAGTCEWSERFGLLPLTEAADAKSRSIRILYVREDQQYPLPVRSPIFESVDKLATQASWSDGRQQYAVTRKRKLKNRDGVQVEVSTNFGRTQTFVVDPSSGVLLSLDEKIIIGRGEGFRLKMELVSQTELSAADLAKFLKPMDALLSIQSELGRTPENMRLELTGGQLNSIQKVLPQLEEQSDGTSWSRLVSSIKRDLVQQKKRLDGVVGLQKQLVGQSAPDWNLKMVDGGTISNADTMGSVVVLHFWQYRGEPMIEPYGQIGYLDFLYTKRKKLGVKVFGINVDERFANRAQKPEAMRSMKKLMEFMNVGYEVAIDDGTVLMEFGDPRAIGAPLPLWVVIGHDGKVSHYQTGFYDIKPDEGLKQLDEAVVEALRKQKQK